MRNSTHIARLLKACSITTGQLLSFAHQSRHLTPRQHSHIASSAAQCERLGYLADAKNLWNQANELAVIKENLDWTAHRAHACEARLRLAAKAAHVRNGDGILHANPQL